MKANKHYSLILEVSSGLVIDFANLVGDFSSLHTNEAFARRSPYRNLVAHGMLPIFFLMTLWKDDFPTYFIRRLRVAFHKPIFVETTVEIELEINGFSFEFRVKDQQSEKILIRGSGVFGEHNGQLGEQFRTQKISQIVSLVTPFVEREVLWEQLKVGDSDAFPFAITLMHVASATQFLRRGVSSDQYLHIDLNLLAVCLLSALIGMRLPGKYATFLDLQFSFEEDVIVDTNYVLQGEIRFKSDSTETLLEDVSIETAEGVNVGSGKTTVNVLRPFVNMPSIVELRKFVNPEFQLHSKVVLITGASRGIGETTAKLFALHGAKVVINYFKSKMNAENIVADILEHGGNAITCKADISDPLHVQLMIQEIARQFGTVDILVNNAVSDFLASPFLELAWEDFQRELNVTLKGPVLCCQAVLPDMLAKGTGKIINVGSSILDTPVPNQAKYITAKSGLWGLTRSLAAEFGPHNIGVTMVMPSMVRTDLTSYIPSSFFKTTITPFDVAKCILKVAASSIVGERVVVEGEDG